MTPSRSHQLLCSLALVTLVSSQLQLPLYAQEGNFADEEQSSSIEKQQSSSSEPSAACSDGEDNDNDGYTDIGQDAGCSSADDNDEYTPQCTDGQDNDGDGRNDMDDPGCSDTSDDDEYNEYPQCDDHNDNDGDGFTDMDDPGCSDSQDNDEFNEIPKAVCEDGEDNDGDGNIDMSDAGCSDPQDGDEWNEVFACSDGQDNDGDGMTDMSDPGCSDDYDQDEFQEVFVCDDDQDNDGDGIIDMNDPGCSDQQDQDEWNEVSSSSSSEESSSSPLPAACNDGFDNDNDGITDFPNDPGCSDWTDEDEYNTSACSDGQDNDGDNVADMMDSGCSYNGDADEHDDPSIQVNADQVAAELLNTLLQRLDEGQVFSKINFFGRLFSWVGTWTDSFIASAQSVDGADLQISMSGPSQLLPTSNADYVITVQNIGPLAAQNVRVFNPVPAFQGGVFYDDSASDSRCDLQGSNVVCALNTIAAGSSEALTISFTVQEDVGCSGSSFMLNGAVVVSSIVDPDLGSNISNLAYTEILCPTPVAQCQDGFDNDFDGRIDFPDDPACSSPDDNDEYGDPQCADFADNDGDGLIDFPQDPGCSDLADNDEFNAPAAQCSDGQDNDGDGFTDFPIDPGCSSAEDNDEFNNVVTAQCNDGQDNDGDNLVDFPNDPGCSSATDNDEFNAPLPQCSDGADNDSDNVIDFPNDPGCSSKQDNDEFNPISSSSSSSPSAQCNDGQDNDGDGFTDFPIDPGCSSAEDNDEFNEASSSSSSSSSISSVPPSSSSTSSVSSDALGISKTDYHDTVNEGEYLTYYITVTNFTSQNHADTIVDTLPAGVTFISATDGGVYNSSNRTVTWTNLMFTSHQSRTVSVYVDVNNNLPNNTTLTNIARLSSVGNEATDTTRVNDAIGICGSEYVYLRDSRDPVNENDEFTYTLIVGNNEDTAVTRDVELELDEDIVDVISISNGGYREDEHDVYWSGVVVPAHGSVELRVTVRVGNDSDGVLYSVAEAKVSYEDENACASDFEETVVYDSTPVCGSEFVYLRDNQDPVNAGDTFQYLTILGNNEDHAITRDYDLNLDANVDFVSADNGGERIGDDVTWQNIAIPAHGTRELRVTVRVRGSVQDNTLLRSDGQTDCASDYETTTVNNDLVCGSEFVYLRDTQDPVEAGSTFQYLTILGNNENYSITRHYDLNLDANVEFVSADNGGVRIGDDVAWSNIVIPEHGSRELRVTVRIKDTVSNQTLLRSDGQTSCASDYETTVALNDGGPTGDLSITKTDNRDTAEEGDYLTYTIRVTNTSGQAITDTIVDTLPSGVTFISATDGGAYNSSNRTITWSNVSFSANASRTVSTYVDINNDLPDNTTLTNTARLTTANKTATDTTQVNGGSTGTCTEESIELRDSDDQVRQNEEFDYIVVIHNDSDTAIVRDIRLDDIDEDLDVRSVHDGGRESGNDVFWDDVTISANSSRELRVTVRVNDDSDDRVRSEVRSECDSDFEETVVTDGTNGDLCNESSIELRDSDNDIDPDEEFEYIVRIRNDADETVERDVRLDVDGDLDVRSVGDGGYESDDDARWDNVRINANSTKELRAIVRVDDNVGEDVRSSVTDGCNSDYEETNTNGEVSERYASLSINKNADRYEVKAGDIINYTIRVNNYGNGYIRNVRVEDDYPENAIAILSTDDGYVQSGIIDWRIGEIRPGQTVELHYTAQARSSLRHGDSIRNTARITSIRSKPGSTFLVRVLGSLPVTGVMDFGSNDNDMMAFISPVQRKAATDASSTAAILFTTVLTGLGAGAFGARKFLI